MSNRSLSPAQMWQATQGELQLQLPRETFNTWLRDARLIAYEDGTFIIGVHNIYAREWLEQRLKKVVVRSLARIARREVEVRFVLASEHPRPADKSPGLHAAGPLLAALEPPPEAPRFERLSPGETGLNERLTFETFAIGASNRLAYTAARAVVEAPATQFNPVCIHAGVGLGKTHLLHALGNACLERGQRVLYASSETFTNDLVAAIRTHKTADFRDKYREIDLLLLDDIQFIAGKDSTQEEFYHTFDALVGSNAQIVVAASLPPGEIKGLDARLRSRLEGGLVVEILPPDFLTRVDILEIKARLRGFAGRLPLDLLERIAEGVDGSVRDLEGTLNQVAARALLAHESAALDLAGDVLSRPRGQPGLTLEDILMAVAEYYGVTPDDLIGRSRLREVSTARQIAMYLANRETDTPLQQIGEVLGGRSHSTVMYSCERIADMMATDSIVRRQVQAILRTLIPQGTPPRRLRSE